MGLKVDPKLIQAEAKSITDNANKYYSLVSGIRDSMNFLVTNSTSEGLAISAAKNQAHAHIIAIDYFEHISVEILMQYQKLVTAISNNEITEQLDEDELRALINQKQEDYHFYDSMVDNIRTIQRNFEFCSSVFDLLKSHYKAARDNALSLKKDYEKKLSNLINLEKASSSYYSSVNTMIKKQNMLLYDLSIAGAKGKFPKTKLANALSIYSAIRDHNIDPNKLLFCKDASGKKVISVEAIGLFADTEKKNMSPLQLSMYNYIINHIHSSECTPHDLDNIIEGYYGQEVRIKKGTSIVSLRQLKKSAPDLVLDLNENLTKLTKNGKSNNKLVEITEFVNTVFKETEVTKVGQVKYHNGYSIKIHTYRYEYGAWKYENGVAHSSTRAVSCTKDITVHTFGKGLVGAWEYKNAVLGDYISKNKFSKRKIMAKTGLNLAQDYISIPGLSSLMDFASDMNNDYNARILAENVIKVELATTTDSYVTQINDECVIRFGPNTEAIMKYMNDNGYPLSGTLKENIETIKNYGESTGVESTVEVRDYIMKKLVEGGYEWIE